MATTMDEPTLEARTRVVIEPLPVDVAGVGSRRTRSVRAPRPVAKACSGSAAPSLHGGRLTRRGRLVVSAAWLVLLVVGVLGVVRPWVGAPDPGEVAEQATSVRVVPGDTLWDVAGRVAPEADRREVVSAIVELNGLRSAGDIRPGDRLVLPESR